MSAEGGTPTRQDVEEELEHILVSDAFATHPVPRALLARLVRGTLNGEAGGKEYEHALGVDVFKKPHGWTRREDNVVRQGLSDLRKHLRVYYTAEGGDDKVEISFPKRSGFAARFSYRPIENAKENVQRFQVTFWQAFPDVRQCDSALEKLKACIERHPSYAPAYGILAEATLACSIFDETRIPLALLQAQEAVKTGLELNSQLWLLHVVAGALHSCRFEWEKADIAFKRAFRLAPDQAGAHVAYAAFLLAVGRKDEAEQCILRRYAQPHTRLTPYLKPLFFYATRRIDEAYFSFPEIERNPPQINGFLKMGIRPKKGFFDFNDRMYGVVPIEEWAGQHLMACVTLRTDYRSEAPQYAKQGVLNSRIDALCGLRICACAEYINGTSGDPPYHPIKSVVGSRCEEEKRELKVLWREFRYDPGPTRGETPVSFALGHMGIGDKGLAVKYLEQACDWGHPLMVWLHLWQVFDPLREDEDFKALIQRMNLPRRDAREG